MQRALDSSAVVVAELTDIVGYVFEVRRGDGAIGKQNLATRNARLWLSTEVEHYLEQLAWIRALVKRAREIGGQRSCQQLDLLIPPGATLGLLALGSHPNDGTSPFSATGTLSASSLTRSICVRRTLNPRPLRASIMWES